MMIKPGISELSSCVDSRYTLVTMAAKRARMIGKARQADYFAFGDEKPVSVAADEIFEGHVGYVRSSAIERAKAWEDEKAAAILSLSQNSEYDNNEDLAESSIEVLDYEDEIAQDNIDKSLSETGADIYEPDEEDDADDFDNRSDEAAQTSEEADE